MITIGFTDYTRFSESSKFVGTLKYLENWTGKICKNTPQITFFSLQWDNYITQLKRGICQTTLNSLITIALALQGECNKSVTLPIFIADINRTIPCAIKILL